MPHPPSPTTSHVHTFHTLALQPRDSNSVSDNENNAQFSRIFILLLLIALLCGVIVWSLGRPPGPSPCPCRCRRRRRRQQRRLRNPPNALELVIISLPEQSIYGNSGREDYTYQASTGASDDGPRRSDTERDEGFPTLPPRAYRQGSIDENVDGMASVKGV